MKRFIVLLLSLSLMPMIFCSCSFLKKDKEESMEESKVIVYADPAVENLVKNIVEDYNSNYKTKVEYEILKKNELEEKLQENTEDRILIGYRDLNGKNLKEDLIAEDGIAIVTSKDSALSNITLEELREIYSGKVKRFGEIFSDIEEMKEIEIEVIAYLEDSTGISHEFSSKILKTPTEKEYGDNVIYVRSAEELYNRCKSKNAIGYILKEDVTEELKILKLNHINLSKDSIKSKIYSLIYPINMYYEENKLNKSLDFVNYVKSEDGKKIIKKYCVEKM